MLIDVLFPEDSGYNKSERKYFTSLKNIVIEPLNYFIKDIKIKNVTKITIQLYKNHQRDFFLEPNRMLSVVVIEKSFDFINKVVHTSNKKKSILDLIRSLLKEASKKFQWNYQLFEDAFKNYVELNYPSSLRITKPKMSRNKKFKAFVEVNIMLDGALILVNVLNNNDILVNKYSLIKTYQNSFFYNRFLGKTKWLNTDEYALFDKKNKFAFVVDVIKNKSRLEIFDKSNEDFIINKLIVESSIDQIDEHELFLKNKMNSHIRKMKN